MPRSLHFDTRPSVFVERSRDPLAVVVPTWTIVPPGERRVLAEPEGQAWSRPRTSRRPVGSSTARRTKKDFGRPSQDPKVTTCGGLGRSAYERLSSGGGERSGCRRCTRTPGSVRRPRAVAAGASNRASRIPSSRSPQLRGHHNPQQAGPRTKGQPSPSNEPPGPGLVPARRRDPRPSASTGSGHEAEGQSVNLRPSSMRATPCVRKSTTGHLRAVDGGLLGSLWAASTPKRCIRIARAHLLRGAEHDGHLASVTATSDPQNRHGTFTISLIISLSRAMGCGGAGARDSSLEVLSAAN